MYLLMRWTEYEDLSTSKSELELSLHCKFVFTKGDPLDEATHYLFKPWRTVIFMNGDVTSVKDIVLFIDAFVHWRTTEAEAK